MKNACLVCAGAALFGLPACSGSQTRTDAAPDGSAFDANDAQVSGSDGSSEQSDANVSADAAPGEGGADGDEDHDPLLCPGAEPLDAPATAKRCRSAADCDPSESCGPYYQASGCGACMPAERLCEEGTCGAGQVCAEYVAQCSCTGEISTRCEPACTSSNCSEDEVCGTSGKCVPRPCTQGYVCTNRQVCAPERPVVDAHGCAVAHCDSDGAGCPAGFRCEPTLSSPGSDGCVAISCTEGYPCPANRACEPDSTELHGCEPRACSEDTDCGCGPCIAGSCRDQLFVCSPPPAP